MDDKVYWVSATGVETDLTDGVNYNVIEGRANDFMPAFEIIDEAIPQQPGSRLKQVNIKPRVINLPLIIYGNGKGAIENKLRSLVSSMYPINGTGKIRIQRGDGSSNREIVCMYTDGLQGNDSGYRNTRQVVLSFRAFDPFWADAANTQLSFAMVGVGTWFPILPLTLIPSSAFGNTDVVNYGDLEAWPVYTIIGPGIDPLIVNSNTGEFIKITKTFSPGDTLIIDTRPGYKTVTFNGVSSFELLSEDTTLFSFQPRTTTILKGYFSGSDTSSIMQLKYLQRYFTA